MCLQALRPTNTFTLPELRAAARPVVIWRYCRPAWTDWLAGRDETITVAVHTYGYCTSLVDTTDTKHSVWHQVQSKLQY